MSSSRNEADPSEHEGFVQIPLQARYYTLGTSVEDSQAILLCLHGYGQLARYFLRKFDSAVGHGIHVVVPEGLHRFYLSGNEGRVGASWMTKEARAIDIQNYCVYLDHVMDQVLEGRDKRIIVLGFSQGAATAGRWIQHTARSVSDLILWAGMFPHDVDLSADASFWSEVDFHSVLGTDDPYIDDERLNAHRQPFTQAGLSMSHMEFKGAHTIEPEALNKLLDRILSH
ncbi:MAG: alpha/beta fold hydrolase [Flavobacteriales bacterium]|nr:alpha/beta fold hydrolase [Flavobacteriales bacterium]